MINRLVMAIAITTAITLGCMWWNTQTEYNNLLAWACESASLGGHECGED
jgi:hypothetical protein